MKNNLTPSQLRLRGNEALFERLGPVGFARFMQQFVSRGDYTKERGKWIDDLDFSDLEGRVSTVKPARKAG